MISSNALDPQVLVVDDDDQLARTVADILRLRGFRPFTVSSARLGLEKAQELAPELAIALVDLRLPDMDGMELVARLRALSDLTEVVVLTGHASMDSVLGALRQESFDYLIKPVDPDRLLDTMSRASERWQRRVIEQRLHESEEKFRLVVENISDMILLLDDEGKVRYASPSAEQILQRSPETIMGHPLPGLMSPASGLRMEEILSGLQAGDSGTVSIEHDLQRAEGREAHVDSTVQRIIAAPGGFLVSSRDVSERKHLEAELFQSRKMESVGRLAGGIAHDFNNLLTVVLGATELCRLEAGKDFGPRAYLDEVVAAAQRGSSMVRQLLAFSRRQVLTPRVIDVNALIEDGRKLLERAIGEDIEFHLDLTPERPHVLADAGQLEQVLMNLAVNARDAMPRGGKLMIRTRMGSPKSGTDWVTIQVADTGDGISPEILRQIFEPFFTTKDLGRGTGLGLATVQGIIHQSGGTIAVESQPREGATFTIELPRVDAVTAKPAARAPRVERPSGQETILLAEDERAVRNVIARSLQRHGYKVIEATTGTEAADILRATNERIDLLLSDLVLPGLTGLELVEIGRQLRPGMRALICSGYSEDAISRRGLTADVRILSKPFEPTQLLAAVRDALDGEALGQALP